MTALHSRTVYAEWLVSAFESRGIASSEIASVSGVGTELIEDTAPRLALEDYLRLLNWAAARCEDPWLGLHLGADWRPRTTAFSYLAPADISTPLQFFGGKVCSN